MYWPLILVWLGLILLFERWLPSYRRGRELARAKRKYEEQK